MPDAPLTRLLASVAGMPSLRVEPLGSHALIRCGDLVVADLDLDTGELTADVAPHLLGYLLNDLPRLRRTARGVRLRVTDGDTRGTAEALLRWRVESERFALQLRDASP
jgi:hypothetical protein